MNILNWALRKTGLVRRAELDKQWQKLGAIIEQHIDDEDWLIEQLGVKPSGDMRKSGHMLIRQGVVNELVKEQAKPIDMQNRAGSFGVYGNY